MPFRPLNFDDQYDFLPSTDAIRERNQSLSDIQGMKDYGDYLDNLNTGDFKDRTPVPPGAFDPTVSDAVKRSIADKTSANPSVPTLGSLGSIQQTSASNPVADAIKAKYGFGQGLDDDSLMKAQGLANQNRSSAGYGQAFNVAINAIAGTKPDNSFFDNMRKEADQPVSDILTRRKGLEENQKFGRDSALTDANSTPSKIAQNFAYSQLVESGMKPADAKARVEGMSAADLKDFGEKSISGLESSAARKEMARLRQSMIGDQKQNQAMQQTMQLLESARGNQAVQKAEQDLYNVGKINSLVQKYSNPSPQMARLLYSEIAKVANGGQATTEELKGLDPQLVTGTLAGAWQKLSGNPTPANVGAFIKDYADYANSVAGDAKNVINDRYGRIIESAKDRVGPQNYKMLQSQYVNRFNKGGPQPASTGSAQPGSIIRYKGATYRVGQDGDTLEAI